MKKQSTTRNTITKEKKEYYEKRNAERIAKLRKAYKEARTNDTMALRNMYFFEYILTTLKMSKKEFSQKTGLSPQAITWWMISDDCKLDNITTAMTKVNINLQAGFENSENFIYVDNENMVIKGKIIITNPKPLAKEIQERIEKGGKLKFLAEMIRDDGYSLASFSAKTGIEVVSIKRWLKEDNIMISKLYKIAQKCNKKVTWKILPTKKR